MQHRALEQGAVNLACDFPHRPALLAGHAQVELALLGALGLGENVQMRGPGQFSQQRREFRLVAPGFIKLAHPPDVLRRKAAQTGLVRLNVVRQRSDRALAPAVAGDPGTDGLTDLPVEVDEGGIDGSEGLFSRRLNHLCNLGEAFLLAGGKRQGGSREFLLVSPTVRVHVHRPIGRLPGAISTARLHA